MLFVVFAVICQSTLLMLLSFPNRFNDLIISFNYYFTGYFEFMVDLGL